jgi:hypothetical protein
VVGRDVEDRRVGIGIHARPDDVIDTTGYGSRSMIASCSMPNFSTASSGPIATASAHLSAGRGLT